MDDQKIYNLELSLGHKRCEAGAGTLGQPGFLLRLSKPPSGQEFPTIGREKILLNAHQIKASECQPPLILLALEDIFTKKRLKTGNVG